MPNKSYADVVVSLLYFNLVFDRKKLLKKIPVRLR